MNELPAAIVYAAPIWNDSNSLPGYPHLPAQPTAATILSRNLSAEQDWDSIWLLMDVQWLECCKTVTYTTD